MVVAKEKGENGSSIIAVPANTINVIKMFLILNWILALGLMIPHFVFGELSRSSEKWTASHGLAISVIIITCIVLILNSLGIYMFHTLYIPPSVARAPVQKHQGSSDVKHSDTEDIVGGGQMSNDRRPGTAGRTVNFDGERRDSQLQIQGTWQLDVKPDEADSTKKGGGSDVIGKLDVGLGVSMFNWWKKDAQERREFEKKAKKRKKINPQKLPDRRKEQPFKYLAVIDFEATCMENEFINPQEIIEFPVHILNSSDSSTKARFHHYVKPIHHPQLTEFCTNLTGITQEVVDLGKTFAEVWYEFREFMEFHGLSENNTVFCISGDWDLKTMWPNQAKLVGLQTPPYFERWVNIKTLCGNEFAQLPKNIIQLLDILGLKHVGHHHSGIDDVENIRNCVKFMLRKGVVFKPTSFLKDLINTPGFG